MNQQEIFVKNELARLNSARKELLELEKTLEAEYLSGVNFLEKYVKKVKKINNLIN